MGTAVAAVLQLPLPERIEAVEAIWESIAADPAAATLPLSDAQRRELDARLDADERDPQAGASWEVVRERVRRPQ
jgi:putative addiction module component (TIGR02574 family)